MDSSETDDKIRFVRHLLDEEGRVMLCVDATLPGVDVPRRFERDEGLRLILTDQMPQPIIIGPRTIETLLGFGGIGHQCVIPLDSLWGAYNPETGHGHFWQASMPESVRKQFRVPESVPAPTRAPAPAEPPPPPPPPKTAFQPKVVAGGNGPALPRPTGKPQLRVVK